MRMGQHDPRLCRREYCEGRCEVGPFDRHFPWRVSTQPAVERGLNIGTEIASHQQPGEVHTRGHRRAGNDLCRELVSGQSAAARQTLTDRLDALAATGAQAAQRRMQLRRRFVDLDTQYMDRPATPACRHLDACQKAQAGLLAGRTRFGTAGESVVIGQCQGVDAPRGGEFDDRTRRQRAVRMMAVKMQIDEPVHPAIIRAAMQQLAAQDLDWDLIDTVLLDLDGTLLDLAFDSFVWLGRVPEIFAEQNGLSVPEAQVALAPKFRQWRGQLQWYCIDFWSRELGIDIEALHRAEASRVGWLPGARGFLDRVRERRKRLVLMTNSHPTILQIKHERTGVLEYFDAAYSSHRFGAPKEDPAFWSQSQQLDGFRPSRSVFVDDSADVLHAAVRAGIAYVYGVRRPDSSSADGHSHEDFLAVDSVADLG